MELREVRLVGVEYLQAATTLLQRVRTAHPTFGLYEAADLQWWWADAGRATETFSQLFWVDDDGRPEAAVTFTDWGDRVGIDPFVLPGAAPDWLVHVFERGLTAAHEAGFGTLGLEVGRDDTFLRQVVERHGFTADEDGFIEAWLAADDRPKITDLASGYRLSSRREVTGADPATVPPVHHLNHPKRSRIDVEERLQQLSLYRPDLDLVVHDARGEVAAFGLFWYDPVSATGLVEPMRTNDEHQRRGLARHILTSGIGRLFDAGAQRIKICYDIDNAPARDLYLNVGFEPDRQTVIYSRPS